MSSEGSSGAPRTSWNKRFRQRGLSVWRWDFWSRSKMSMIALRSSATNISSARVGAHRDHVRGSEQVNATGMSTEQMGKRRVERKRAVTSGLDTGSATGVSAEQREIRSCRASDFPAFLMHLLLSLCLLRDLGVRLFRRIRRVRASSAPRGRGLCGRRQKTPPSPSPGGCRAGIPRRSLPP